MLFPSTSPAARTFCTNEREARFGIPQTGYSGLTLGTTTFDGLLSGKYGRDKEVSEGRHVEGWDKPPVYGTEKLYDIIDVLGEIGGGHGVTASQLKCR